MPTLPTFPPGVDPYNVLGVGKKASNDEIRQAYLGLAMKHHPDKARGQDIGESTKRFQEIQAAYEALTPANRPYYDAGFGGLVTGKTDLMAACERADTARVRKLLENSVDVCECDSTGRTALFFAAGAADVESIRLLLSHNADVDARNCAGHSCVMFGVGAGLVIDSAAKAERALRHVEAVRLLLDEGAPVEAATCYGLTALMLACVSGRLNMIELLLSRGADAKAQSDIGLTALAMAADKGFAQVCHVLLKALADPNQSYAAKKTPLMGAAAQAHTDVVEVLLVYRAEVNAVSNDGHTPLLFAVEKNLKDGLVCPIQGAEVEKPGALSTVIALLKARSDPNWAGPKKRTPLHVACLGGSANLVKELIIAHANVEAIDEAERTPAELVHLSSFDEVLVALQARKDQTDAPPASCIYRCASKPSALQDCLMRFTCFAFCTGFLKGISS